MKNILMRPSERFHVVYANGMGISPESGQRNSCVSWSEYKRKLKVREVSSIKGSSPLSGFPKLSFGLLLTLARIVMSPWSPFHFTSWARGTPCRKDIPSNKSEDSMRLVLGGAIRQPRSKIGVFFLSPLQ